MNRQRTTGECFLLMRFLGHDTRIEIRDNKADGGVFANVGSPVIRHRGIPLSSGQPVKTGEAALNLLYGTLVQAIQKDIGDLESQIGKLRKAIGVDAPVDPPSERAGALNAIAEPLGIKRVGPDAIKVLAKDLNAGDVVVGVLGGRHMFVGSLPCPASEKVLVVIKKDQDESDDEESAYRVDVCFPEDQYILAEPDEDVVT